VSEGARQAGRDSGAIDRMLEVKLSYDRDPARALENTRFWAPLSLTAEQKHNVASAVEMERPANELPIEQVAGRWIVASEPEEAIARIRPYVDAGFGHLVVHGPGHKPRGFLTQFAKDFGGSVRRTGSSEHNCAVPETAVPQNPLPPPRYARVAVIGPLSDFSEAVVDAFSAGRHVDHLLPQELSLRSVPLSQDLDVVFVTIEPGSLPHAFQSLAELLSDLVVVVCASAVSSDNDGFFMEAVPGGSVTNLVARLLPNSRVVGALQQFTAEHVVLATLGALDTDVPVVSNDVEAADLVEALLDEIRGFDSVYAGQLRSSAAVEGLAAIIGEVSQARGGPVGFRLTGTGIRILDR
jgi:predicted dinucleotide-binding enzyme